jgi:TrmH family RNA methyltransferase
VTAGPQLVTSRSNPLLVELRRLVRDGASYRRGGRLWLEGEHLCQALLARGGRPEIAVVDERAWADVSIAALAQQADRVVTVPPVLFADLSTLESPARIGFVHALAAAPAIEAEVASVVLDRLQDPGNVGSILRSAAAFGVRQVLALTGTVALWSPKVLRAGMGAHFGLRLVEGLRVDELDALRVPLVATSSHARHEVGAVPLPRPCAWVLGHEGQGVDEALAARCALTLRIPQPGGEESLNVAAAAAVCLYESARQAGAGRPRGQ